MGYVYRFHNGQPDRLGLCHEPGEVDALYINLLFHGDDETECAIKGYMD